MAHNLGKYFGPTLDTFLSDEGSVINILQRSHAMLNCMPDFITENKTVPFTKILGPGFRA